jgi:UDP-glucuronate 4-epimerase
MPLRVSDRVDEPLSLYGATKRANELMAYAYAHLFGLPATGLRFFTVYGPWGRPDMAMWLFTQAIFENRPVRLYNPAICAVISPMWTTSSKQWCV